MFIFALFFLLILLNPAEIENSEKSISLLNNQSFSSIFEPSGIADLGNKHFIIVEDESERPIHLAYLNHNGKLIEQGELPINGKALRLNDLEGAAFDGQFTYVIGSHSLTKKSKKGKDRRVFARFDYQQGALHDARVIRDLRAKIIQQIEPLLAPLSADEIGAMLDIEGLMWSPNSNSLLIGLRAPLVLGKSLLLQLNNAREVFAQQSAERADLQAYLLNLGGKGIRALAWNESLNRIMIIAGQSARAANDVNHELWAWTGSPKITPERVNQNLANGAEGLAILDLDGLKQAQKALIVVDDGNQKAKAFGHYRVIPISRDLAQ